jgi:hypothetical protein
MLATLTGKALVIAHEDNSDPTSYRLLQSVTGIIFFGTPHRGSGTANLGNLVGTMVNTFLKAASAWQTKTIRTDLLRHLESDSKALQGLAESVRNRLGSLQVVSFYETEPESPWPSVSYLEVSQALINERGPQPPANSPTGHRGQSLRDLGHADRKNLPSLCRSSGSLQIPFAEQRI